MKPTIAGSRLLRQARDRLYTGTIRRFVQRVGLNDYLSGPYWRLVFTLTDETQTHSIDEQTVSFHTESFDEFMRFNDFKGERPIIKDLLQSLEPDDVFYDIGANVGTYTCFAASKLGLNAVVAYEPEPKNAARLQENLNLNGLDSKIVEVALSDSDGTTELALAGEEAGEGEHAIATSGEQETIEVETARLDRLVKEREVPPPTVVKIDVEGAEISVLRGMEQILQEYCRLVYVEVHPDKINGYGGTPKDIYSLLENAGFKTEKTAHLANRYFVKAEVKTKGSENK